MLCHHFFLVFPRLCSQRPELVSCCRTRSGRHFRRALDLIMWGRDRRGRYEVAVSSSAHPSQLLIDTMGWAGRRSLESAVYGTEDCSRCVVCPTKVSPVTFTPGFFVRPQSTRREGSDVSVTHVFACLAERRSFLEPHFLGGYLTSPDQLEHQLGSLRRMSKARRGACESWVGGIGV